MHILSRFILVFILSTNSFYPNNFLFCQTTNPDWTLEREGEGIKVYTRRQGDTNIKEFKAITLTTQPMSTLENLIEKVENYPDWQENVTTAKLLKQVNSNEQYIHYTSDTPWPIKDRDIVSHSKKTVQDDGTVTYTLTSKPEYLEEFDDYLRIRDAKGLWEFTPQKSGEIQITYQFYGDPAGNLPDWLINMFIVSGPYNTLMNIKNL